MCDTAERFLDETENRDERRYRSFLNDPTPGPPIHPGSPLDGRGLQYIVYQLCRDSDPVRDSGGIRWPVPLISVHAT